MTTSRRVFRPKWWAVLLTILFVVLTIRLGHWQGDRASYKIEQQRQLDSAMAEPPLDVWKVRADSTLPGAQDASDVGAQFRYRAVKLVGTFDREKLYFVDNRIQDGKAGYAVLQRFRAKPPTEPANETREFLVERGWVSASLDRAKLPAIDTPEGEVAITGRINQPRSRNPGTQDNESASNRLNYVNIAELTARTGVKFEPYVLDQTEGAGFIVGTERAAPSFGHQKNLAYQVQWYAFAALALVLFIVFSFKKVERSNHVSNA
jgi:surfeit locus 1 family protein